MKIKKRTDRIEVTGGLLLLKGTNSMLKPEKANLCSLKIDFQTFPSDLNAISLAEEKLADFVATNRLDGKVIAEFTIALSEAFTNAVNYGTARGRPKKFHVNVFYLNEKFLYVFIADAARMFHIDSKEIEAAVADENLSKDHGRGLNIMCQLADLVAFNISPKGKCKELLLGIQYPGEAKTAKRT